MYIDIKLTHRVSIEATRAQTKKYVVVGGPTFRRLFIIYAPPCQMARLGTVIEKCSC